jgi:hypothetical protein
MSLGVRLCCWPRSTLAVSNATQVLARFPPGSPTRRQTCRPNAAFTGYRGKSGKEVRKIFANNSWRRLAFLRCFNLRPGGRAPEQDRFFPNGIHRVVVCRHPGEPIDIRFS